ncbi:MAG: hypothetical protein R3B67_00535 [Phycisphaerales bacterium]
MGQFHRLTPKSHPAWSDFTSMKYAKAPIVFVAALCSTLPGCASLPQAEHQAPLSPAQPTITVEPQMLWGEVLAELFPLNEQARTPETDQVMPTLIAGDWLAMQCAFMGGYWDLGHNNDAPTFAGAPESWFQLD